MADNYTPFGYRYVNNTCIIKLRLHPKKFQEAGITHLGTHRTTQNGYVIFEATLDTKSDSFKEFTQRMKPAQ